MSRFALVLPMLCIALAGCGDGTVEIKSQTTPSKVIIVDKPQVAKETVKTESTNINGTTTKTKETTTTIP